MLHFVLCVGPALSIEANALEGCMSYVLACSPLSLAFLPFPCLHVIPVQQYKAYSPQ